MLQIMLDTQCRRQSAGPQQIMSAAMAGPTGGQFLLFDTAAQLGKPGKGIILRQNANDGTPAAVALKEIVPADKVLLQEPMKLHTTFRIGGPADCLVYLENEEQLCKIQKYLRLVDVPYTVIGNGSNQLFILFNGFQCRFF